MEARSGARLYCYRSVCLEWSEGQAGGGARGAIKPKQDGGEQTF